MSQKVKAFVCRVLNAPVVEEIGTDLESLQKLVGGYVECVPLGHGLTLWCNEDGISLGLPLNRGVLAYAPEIPEGFESINANPIFAAPCTVGIHWIRGDFFVVREVDAEDGPEAVDITELDEKALHLRLREVRR